MTTINVWICIYCLMTLWRSFIIFKYCILFLSLTLYWNWDIILKLQYFSWISLNHGGFQLGSTFYDYSCKNLPKYIPIFTLLSQLEWFLGNCTVIVNNRPPCQSELTKKFYLFKIFVKLSLLWEILIFMQCMAGNYTIG